MLNRYVSQEKHHAEAHIVAHAADVDQKDSREAGVGGGEGGAAGGTANGRLPNGVGGAEDRFAAAALADNGDDSEATSDGGGFEFTVKCLDTGEDHSSKQVNKLVKKEKKHATLQIANERVATAKQARATADGETASVSSGSPRPPVGGRSPPSPGGTDPSGSRMNEKRLSTTSWRYAKTRVTAAIAMEHSPQHHAPSREEELRRLGRSMRIRAHSNSGERGSWRSRASETDLEREKRMNHQKHVEDAMRERQAIEQAAAYDGDMREMRPSVAPPGVSGCGCQCTIQ